jgi:Transposase DDE domain/SWIM zinc finger
MDLRAQRAEQLAGRAHITFEAGHYLVPSASRGGCYCVDLDGTAARCTCPDYDLRAKDCKHILAARLWRDAGGQNVPTADPDPPPVKRPTYSQDWVAYNLAQTRERSHFMQLLADLTTTIPEPPRKPGPGRPPIPLADAVYSAVFKVYSTMSARRFNGDLEDACDKGYVSRVPHFNSVLGCLDNPAVTPILTELIRLSGLPLRAVEDRFAVDSSGFATCRFERWIDKKYGVPRHAAAWVKAHVCTGTDTHVITAAEVLEQHSPDAPQLPGLVQTTAKDFTVREVSADKAYCGRPCFDAVETVGGTLYSPFLSQATGGVGGTYAKMFHLFCANRDDYLTHYHRRSNIESTFSMVKRKFGDAVRAKSDTAMRNEVLAKFVCHNICCCIMAIYELGITPLFGDACTKNEEAAHIIKFPCV